MKEPVVAVALSGGIDSLVSGFLVKQSYKTVFGIHFTTGYEKNRLPIKLLEKQLGFEVVQVDLSDAFEKHVVDYFVSTYLKGQTPNPCMVCNQTIKFGRFLDEALNLGADYLATGHYARVVNQICFPDKSIQTPWLEKGADARKDQSYFLARLDKDQLKRVIFPLAEVSKDRVRQMAYERNLVPLTPSESQDICFIDEKNFSDFIVDKTGICPAQGPIVDLDGNVVGTHNGLHQFTIGQRRGIDCPAVEPYYVRRIDPVSNTLVVCFKKDLGQKEMSLMDLSWNHPSMPGSDPRVFTKIRYSHTPAPSRLIIGKNLNRVVFEQPQYAVTPGQAAVFYKDARVMGSGIIQ